MSPNVFFALSTLTVELTKACGEWWVGVGVVFISVPRLKRFVWLAFQRLSR